MVLRLGRRRKRFFWLSRHRGWIRKVGRSSAIRPGSGEMRWIEWEKTNSRKKSETFFFRFSLRDMKQYGYSPLPVSFYSMAVRFFATACRVDDLRFHRFPLSFSKPQRALCPSIPGWAQTPRGRAFVGAQHAVPLPFPVFSFTSLPQKILLLELMILQYTFPN